MMGHTHLVIGIAFGLLLVNMFAVSDGGMLILAAGLGALVPDIDHPHAYISTINAITKGFAQMVQGAIGHRTYTHTLEASVLVTLLFLPLWALISWDLILASSGFFVGYLSHLFADSFTKSGIPLTFKGVHKKKYGLKIIRTGRKEEHYFAVVLVFLLIYSMGFF